MMQTPDDLKIEHLSHCSKRGRQGSIHGPQAPFVFEADDSVLPPDSRATCFAEASVWYLWRSKVIALQTSVFPAAH